MQIGPSQSTLQAFGTPLAASEPVRVAAPRANEGAAQSVSLQEPVQASATAVAIPASASAEGSSGQGGTTGGDPDRPGQRLDIVV